MASLDIDIAQLRDANNNGMVVIVTEDAAGGGKVGEIALTPDLDGDIETALRPETYSGGVDGRRNAVDRCQTRR